MAENKKSFVLYADLIHTVSRMPVKKAGELFITILQYVNDQNPVPSDQVVELVFEPIKQQLKRDLKEWDIIKKDRSVSGKLGNLKRWHKDLYDKVVKKEMTIADAENIAKDRRAMIGVANIAVNVNDNVNVGENTAPLIEYRIEECLTVAMNDERWVKANKATTDDLKEFNKLLERRGHYKKNPADYKSHFANWKAGGKKESFFDRNESSAPPLTIIQHGN